MKRYFLLLLGVFLLAACVGHEKEFVRSLSAPTFADWILLNGKVITLNKSSSTEEGVAVKDGVIVAVGSDGEMRRWHGPNTKEVNLAGRTVIPGLNDSHIQATLAGLTWDFELHWENLRSLSRAVGQIAAAAKEQPAGTWIVVAGGWMPTQFAERRLPTRAEIDAVAPRHPVYIQILGQAALLNSAALRAVALTRETRDPPGGQFERDKKTGELTGYALGPSAWEYVYSKIPRPTLDKMRQSLSHCFRELNRLGLTSVADLHTAKVNFAHRRLLHDMARTGELTLRVSFYIAAGESGEELEQLKRAVSEIEQLKQTDLFRFAGFAYNPSRESSDAVALQPEAVTLNPSIKAELRRTLQFVVAGRHNFQLHGLQDRSARQLLDVIEEVNRETPLSGLRIGFAPMDDASPETIERVKKLGAGIVVQSRLALLGESVGQFWDEEKILNAPPLRTILDSDIPLGAGTDAFRSNNYSPMLALWWLVTGQSITGSPMRNAKQNLSRMEALRAYTLGSGWFTEDEEKKGSIERGKFADLVVLNGDYLTIPTDRIPALESLLTMVGGRIVYASGPFAKFAKR